MLALSLHRVYVIKQSLDHLDMLTRSTYLYRMARARRLSMAEQYIIISIQIVSYRGRE